MQGIQVVIGTVVELGKPRRREKLRLVQVLAQLPKPLNFLAHVKGFALTTEAMCLGNHHDSWFLPSLQHLPHCVETAARVCPLLGCGVLVGKDLIHLAEPHLAVPGNGS